MVPTRQRPAVVVDTATAPGDLLVALEAAGLRLVGADAAGVVAAAEAARAAAMVVFEPGTAVSRSQELQVVAPGLPVIVAVADDAAASALLAELATAPGISRNTRVVARSSGLQGVVDLVVAEADAAVRLQHHAAVVQRVREAPLVPTTTPESTTRYLGQLLDHAPIGIVAVDRAGTIQAVNPKACELLGRRVSDAVGTPLRDLFHGVSVIGELIDVTTGTDDAAIETLVRRGPEGTDQHVEVTFAAVDPELASLGSIALLHDVTERVHALEREAAARSEAEAAAERFAAMARTLQQSLLPPLPPVVPGVELAFRYHSAGDGTSVSGDFYDAFRLADGRYCVVLGDVSGKGVVAASLTALARWTLRTAALRGTGLDDLFQALNSVLLDHEHGERFCTLVAVALRVEADAIEVTAATAGHPSPTVVRADGSLFEICQPAAPAGLFELLEIEEDRTTLRPGDALVMTTDGVTEARSPDGRFAPDLLREVLEKAAGWSATEIAASIESTVLGYERNLARDDVAIAALSIPIRGPVEVGPPPPSDQPGDTFSRRYPLDPRSVSQARSDLGSWARAHARAHDDVVDVVVLSASELVTNAVRAARTGVDVTAETGSGSLTMVVSDDGVGFAPTRMPRHGGDDLSESGHGLLLVEALARKVRIRSGSEGTTVTCEFDTEPPDHPA